jgi:hypothetical protein
MRSWLDQKAKDLGLPHNPLPEFTAEEKTLNKGAICLLRKDVTLIVVCLQELLTSLGSITTRPG